MYKLGRRNAFGEVATVFLQVGDVLKCIPFAEANTDYQAYLKWLEEGNTPEPADQGPTE